MIQFHALLASEKKVVAIERASTPLIETWDQYESFVLLMCYDLLTNNRASVKLKTRLDLYRLLQTEGRFEEADSVLRELERMARADKHWRDVDYSQWKSNPHSVLLLL
jgi:hypothetical protein